MDLAGHDESRQQRRDSSRVRRRQEHRHSRSGDRGGASENPLLAVHQYVLRGQRRTVRHRSRARPLEVSQHQPDSVQQRPVRERRAVQVRSVHGDHVELASNDRFFLGKPGLEHIYLRIIPDENTTVNLLRTHEIDWMFEASIDNYPSIQSVPGVRIAWDEINGYEDVQLNVSRPYLQDTRVRDAVAYGIDKKRLIQTSTYGQQRIATEDQPPFMWAYDPNVPLVPFDPAKARALLESAGWSPGSDGIMTKNGQRLTLVMVSNNSNRTRRKNSVVIQASLRQAGIDVQIKYFPGDVLFAPAGEGGILQSGKFDLSLAGWSAGIDPDDSTQFTCANLAPAGYNYSRYCNPDMEAAQKTALENYDQPARKKAYSLIQHYLYRDKPMLFLWWQRFMQPVNVDFKGFSPNPAIENWNSWQWSI